ncbi:MAG: hypothetical protein AB2A00_15890 [Myxococcota bacterium]
MRPVPSFLFALGMIVTAGCTVTEENTLDPSTVKLAKLQAAGPETWVKLVRRCVDRGNAVEKGARAKVVESLFVLKERGREDKVGWRGNGLIDPERAVSGTVPLPPNKVEALYLLTLEDKRQVYCPRGALEFP